MKIALTDAPSVLVAYLEKHVLPKAQLTSEKAAVATAMFIVTKKGTELINNPVVIEKAKMIGALDNSGYVDVDYLKEMASFALGKSGNKFQMSARIPFVNVELGYVFDQEDIEAIYKIAETVAK